MKPSFIINYMVSLWKELFSYNIIMGTHYFTSMGNLSSELRFIDIVTCLFLCQ